MFSIRQRSLDRCGAVGQAQVIAIAQQFKQRPTPQIMLKQPRTERLGQVAGLHRHRRAIGQAQPT